MKLLRLLGPLLTPLQLETLRVWLRTGGISPPVQIRTETHWYVVECASILDINMDAYCLVHVRLPSSFNDWAQVKSLRKSEDHRRIGNSMTMASSNRAWWHASAAEEVNARDTVEALPFVPSMSGR